MRQRNILISPEKEKAVAESMGKIAGKLFVRWNFVVVSCGYFIGMFSYRFLSFDMDVMVSAYGIEGVKSLYRVWLEHASV